MPSWCPGTQSDPGMLILQASGPETGVTRSFAQSLNNQTQHLPQFIFPFSLFPLIFQGSAWCLGEAECKQFKTAEFENKNGFYIQEGEGIEGKLKVGAVH